MRKHHILKDNFRHMSKTIVQLKHMSQPLIKQKATRKRRSVSLEYAFIAFKREKYDPRDPNDLNFKKSTRKSADKFCFGDNFSKASRLFAEVHYIKPVFLKANENEAHTKTETASCSSKPRRKGNQPKPSKHRSPGLEKKDTTLMHSNSNFALIEDESNSSFDLSPNSRAKRISIQKKLKGLESKEKCESPLLKQFDPSRFNRIPFGSKLNSKKGKNKTGNETADETQKPNRQEVIIKKFDFEGEPIGNNEESSGERSNEFRIRSHLSNNPNFDGSFSCERPRVQTSGQGFFFNRNSVPTVPSIQKLKKSKEELLTHKKLSCSLRIKKEKQNERDERVSSVNQRVGSIPISTPKNSKEKERSTGTDFKSASNGKSASALKLIFCQMNPQFERKNNFNKSISQGLREKNGIASQNQKRKSSSKEKKAVMIRRVNSSVGNKSSLGISNSLFDYNLLKYAAYASPEARNKTLAHLNLPFIFQEQAKSKKHSQRLNQTAYHKNSKQLIEAFKKDSK